jgi:hypothetical protein
MRISKRLSGDAYSPDDRDIKGFIALVSTWVEEGGLSYHIKDIEEFCEKWTAHSNVNLRTKKQWLEELYQFINTEVRYRS